MTLSPLVWEVWEGGVRWMAESTLMVILLNYWRTAVRSWKECIRNFTDTSKAAVSSGIMHTLKSTIQNFIASCCDCKKQLKTRCYVGHFTYELMSPLCVRALLSILGNHCRAESWSANAHVPSETIDVRTCIQIIQGSLTNRRQQGTHLSSSRCYLEEERKWLGAQKMLFSKLQFWVASLTFCRDFVTYAKEPTTHSQRNVWWRTASVVPHLLAGNTEWEAGRGHGGLISESPKEPQRSGHDFRYSF